jgi:DNA-binding SARP family transcriptional activator/DNA-binding CsgD family transcriptional regulator
MEFRILGPLEVCNDAGVVSLGGPLPRALLAMLLLHANQPVPVERLAAALWGDEALAGAGRTLQVYVSRLRKALGEPDRLVIEPAGYRLRLRAGELDAERFEHRVSEGLGALTAGQPERAASELREALSLWRGPALAELASVWLAPAEIARLEERRLAAVEACVEAELGLGRHAELVAELQAQIAEHPWRERLHAQLMLALYRSGRQAEALEVYRRGRGELVEQLGLEPSARLQRLEQAILTQSAELEAPPTVRGPPPRFPRDEARARRPPTSVRGGTRLRSPTAPMTVPGPDVAGRDKECCALASFFDRVSQGPAALVLSGEPGIGKTTLWDAAVHEARGRGQRPLCCSGFASEVTFAFAALSDLLAGVVEEALGSLSGPRRRALEAALLLAEPGDAPIAEHAVALAFLDVIRVLAESGPVVIAVDDLQWLDVSSSAVLQYALRRLREERVGFLATVRTPDGATIPVELEPSLPESAIRVSVGPLPRHALHQLLKQRYGLGLSRPELARVYEETRGNPFFALEVGRELGLANARMVPGQPLPMPGSLRSILRSRLERLPPDARDLLLTVAALARPTVEVVEAVHGPASTRRSLEEAIRAGVVALEGPDIRFTHPLLASVAYEQAPIWRRRTVHRALGAVITDPEQRARHLALGSTAPDAAIASALDAAIDRAAARGATPAAAELAELAVELTPPSTPTTRQRRSLRAADYYRLAGNRERASQILEELVHQAPAGPERADALLSLASTRRADLPRTTALCEQALREARDDDGRCAQILAFLSWMRLLAGEVGTALAQARMGPKRAELAHDPRLTARAIARVAMAETWALDITPGLVERGVAIEQDLAQPLEFHESPTVALARRLICLGDFQTARPLLQRAEEHAAGRGDEGTRAHLLFHLVILETFSGRWDQAIHYAAIGRELGEQLPDEQYRGMAAYAQMWVDTHVGNVEPARAIAEQAFASAETAADTIFPIWIAAALGHLELSLGDVDAAAEQLRPLPGRLIAIGWNDPTDEVWPDTIEALVAQGELETARSYVGAYQQRAVRSTSPWALAAAGRCRALLAAATGDHAGALQAFEDALTAHDRTESPFERARTLLALGSVQRRARQKRAAREPLEQAVAAFDRLGARLWCQRAREELARLPTGRRSGAPLSETEQRVAALAGQGRTNKEIASALFISVHTVEAHLTRIYATIGVRSRTELAQRLAIAAPDTGESVGVSRIASQPPDS